MPPSLPGQGHPTGQFSVLLVLNVRYRQCSFCRVMLKQDKHGSKSWWQIQSDSNKPAGDAYPEGADGIT